MSLLNGARVVLYVTGGIAAYKVSDLSSKLTQAGTEVDVVLSRAAEDFVGPLTFQALTQRTVYRADDAMTADNEIAHVRLAAEADVLLVAPATANAIARLAHGQADDLGSAVALSTQAPMVVAPAMEPGMYANPATQDNLDTLRRRGVHVIEPESGRMASGAQGQGRLPETPVLLDVIRATVGRDGPLKDRVLVVSAGGTREYMDPVRFIGNPASGRQGVELARAAIERGATTRLVLGSGTVEPPAGAETVRVESAGEMLEALQDAVQGCDALIMNAAVGDYRPASSSDVKLKRGGEPAGIDLIENPDLLQALQGDFLRDRVRGGDQRPSGERAEQAAGQGARRPGRERRGRLGHGVRGGDERRHDPAAGACGHRDPVDQQVRRGVSRAGRGGGNDRRALTAASETPLKGWPADRTAGSMAFHALQAALAAMGIERSLESLVTRSGEAFWVPWSETADAETMRYTRMMSTLFRAVDLAKVRLEIGAEEGIGSAIAALRKHTAAGRLVIAPVFGEGRFGVIQSVDSDGGPTASARTSWSPGQSNWLMDGAARFPHISRPSASMARYGGTGR